MAHPFQKNYNAIKTEDLEVEQYMEIRPARMEDSRGIAHVNVVTWQVAYQNIIADSYLANLSETQIADTRQRWFRIKKRTDFAYVALNESQEIIGFVIGGKIRTKFPEMKGEIGAIYILPSYQGKGLGRNLMQVASSFLEQNRMIPFLLWVLEKNPTRAFYEHLGGIYLQQKAVKIGDQSLQEIAYRFNQSIEIYK